MRNNRSYLIDGLRIAMAYVGTVVGAGFATGQEILQFFTRFGCRSYWALLLSALLFFLVGRRILLLGKRLQAKSYGLLIDYIFGPVSSLVNIYLAVSYVFLCGSMFAGGGALLKEQWNIPYIAGALIMGIATLLVAVCGVKGILAANSVISPVIVIFSLIILSHVLRQDIHPAAALQMPVPGFFPLLRTGLTYACFNIILSVGVLAPLGDAVNDDRALFFGSLAGGGFLGLLLLIGNYSLLLYVPEVFNREIPMLLIVSEMGGVFIKLYGMLIWLEIFSTSIGNLFSVNTIIQDKFGISSNVPAVIVTGFGLLICTLGFSNIVSWIYPVLGIIGFVLIAFILIQSRFRAEVKTCKRRS